MLSLLRRITQRFSKKHTIDDLVNTKTRVSYPADSPLADPSLTCRNLERLHRGLIVLNQIDRHR